MRVSAEAGTWVVPPQRAVWIPARVEHAIEMRSAVSMRTLYFSGNVVPHLPKSCAVVNVSPLLRELVLRAMSFEPKRQLNETQRRLAAVLLDEIHELPIAPLYLPSPRDERLTRLTDRLAANPGNVSTLGDWGRDVGASARTLARLFAAEDVVSAMAGAAAAHRRHRAAGFGRAGHEPRNGSRLREHERLHLDVSKKPRHLAGPLFQRFRSRRLK